jgi:hypothetical protein
MTVVLPATSTRVEHSTAPEVNAEIRRGDNAAIARFEAASAEAVSSRLGELDGEWDVERVLQANAGTIALIGAMLGYRVHPRFFLLPAAVFGFFLQHALQGWCPPIPVFRRMGVRTTREIARERYALKAMRGDFDTLAARAAVPTTAASSPAQRVKALLAAIDA